MILQERDKLILRLCYEHQFILTEHTLGLFQNGSYKEARRRLLELNEEGFLFHDKNTTLGLTPVIRLTSLGAQIAASETQAHIAQKRVLKFTELYHDAIVTGARLRLSSVWPDAKFIPEALIKKADFKRVPDGVFQFASGKNIAIEVENSDKGKSRVLNLLSRWSDRPDVILILYIATSESLFNSFMRYLSAAPQEQPAGLIRWEDLKTGLPLVWTQRGSLPLLERKSF